jgi:lysophospholipase L1-like esterase
MRKAWLAVGGTVAALLLAELIVRAVTEDPFEGLGESRDSWRVVGLQSDPELEFSFQPGYSGRMTLAGEYDVPFRINAQGLRDDHEYAAEHPGTARVLLVGDSFVFGVGVELQDSLGKQLEQALNAGPDGAPPPRPVEVVAAGVPSYGLDAYALLVERWVPRLRPDLVVVALYPGNDLLDYELKATDPRVVIEGMLVNERIAWSWKLRRASSLAHLLLQRFNPKPRIENHRPDRMQASDIERLFHTMQPWVARIAAADAAGTPVAVTACYARESVPHWRDGTVEATIPPWKELLADFAEHGVTVLDPKPAWIAAPSVREFFFSRDAHYTAAGNRFIARWLAERLREEFAPELDGAGAAAAGAAGAAVR